MQVILLHWDTSVRLQTPSKRRSASYIEAYTGIQNYSAKESQRTQLEQPDTNWIDEINKLIES